MTKPTVRILIADDNEFVRRGIRTLLGLRPNWEVCGEAADGRDAVRQCQELEPDVALLDVSMPQLSGLEAARIIRKEIPNTRVLVVSQHDATHIVDGAREAGARGYVVKSELSQRLLGAIDSLLAGTGDGPASHTDHPASDASFELPLIMVAENDSEVRSLVLPALRSRYRVSDVSTGEELLNLAAERQPELILVDTSMPGMEGFEVLRALRKNPSTSQIPVVLLSARSGDESRIEGVEAGADDYLSKPFSAVELLARLSTHLRMVQLRRQAELAEREKDRQFRIAADIAPAMIWLSGEGTGRTYFNKQWLEFTGRTMEQEVGSGWSDGIHSDDRERCLRIYESSLERREPVKVEYRLRRADGQYRWVLSHGVPRLNGAGVFEGYVGSVMEISERKSAEDARARLAAIVQSSDDAIVGKDLRGIVTNWNNAAERIFGYSEQEMIGKPIAILIPPELQQEEEHILRRLMAGERIDHFETVRVTKGGKRLHVSLTISPIKDASGQIIGASKISRDITAMKEVEQALRESEQRMRFTLEAANFGTWYWEFASGKVTWSDNMEAILGLSPGSFRGSFESFAETVKVEDRGVVKEAIQNAISGNGKYHAEYRQAKADGSLSWIETHGQVLYNQSVPAAMMGVCWDVTQRKNYEEALRQTREQLEVRVRERTGELEVTQERLRMLSGRLLRMQDDERRRIARELHDTVGQIVVALNLNLVPVEEELLKTNPALAEQITGSLGLVDELSRDLRTISHLLHPPLLDEAGLQSALQWFVEGFSQRSRIEVDLRLDPALGRLPHDHETAIFRIVQECLTNIHRHSGSDTASIHLARKADQVQVEICDQGKGMPIPVPRAGVGIQGMGERVRQLGGSLEIGSTHSGTRVLAIFPSPRAASRAKTEKIKVAS
jgi:PAS domain S-box-containing protein